MSSGGCQALTGDCATMHPWGCQALTHASLGTVQQSPRVSVGPSIFSRRGGSRNGQAFSVDEGNSLNMRLAHEASPAPRLLSPDACRVLLGRVVIQPCAYSATACSAWCLHL